ncbi:glycoside hydrolase family 27 protein [Baudoinia panamericana UAMH 10762]|uniref:Alpha-galactosidase n=1 Tax=Baudoinia panamericana (strain UAMH 10762) TaxID=717646 RepID=M2NAF2_BAUPA|nr:glycoside hydrolase family 27 protein [Baudoinia panamericana UAMH 10762]EMC96109.1 glycoside hydrolase family 27 protein [Baudoinia panamericana UAMH 10762]
MGYDTFNGFAGDYNASDVLIQAQIMSERGLVDAGYTQFILDDFNLEAQRNATGYIVANQTRFPNGMPALSKQMNALGVQLAAYSDLGYKTCGGFPGSWGHELQDLETWYSWGMTYLKLDHCYFPQDNITQENIYGTYTPMANAIAEFAARTNVTFIFSLCEWGLEQPWVWGKQLGQSWRIDNDVKPWWSSIATVITQASYQYWATDFYGHNDMDILEVGNTNGIGNPPGNLTYEESKSHFTAWALLKSPLIIGTDLTKVSNETFTILGNRDLIKINQDPNVGTSITPFRWGNNSFKVGNPNYPAVYWPNNPASPAQYWSGNSSYGVVIMILNTANQAQNMSFALAESWLLKAGRQYEVYDMWAHRTVGTAVRSWSVTLPAHGVSALLLNDAGAEPAWLNGTCANQYFCSAPNGSLIYPNAFS